MVSLVGCAFVVVFPALVWRNVLRRAPDHACFELDDPPAPRCKVACWTTSWRTWVLGAGDWVSDCDMKMAEDEAVLGARGMWFEQWGGVFKPVLPQHVSVGVLQKLAEAGACRDVDAATAAAFILSAAVTAAVRPHARGRDDFAFFLLSLLQGVLLAVRAEAHARCDIPGDGMGYLLIGITAVLLAKVIADRHASCVGMGDLRNHPARWQEPLA
eukprot:gene27615-18168_t